MPNGRPAGPPPASPDPTWDATRQWSLLRLKLDAAHVALIDRHLIVHGDEAGLVPEALGATGGFLDRFDSLLFVVHAFYAFVRLLTGGLHF